MEYAGGEHRVRPAGEEYLGHVGQGSGAAAGDDRDADGFADAPGDDEVEAGLGAIGIDGIEDDFAGAERDGLPGPVHGIEAGVGAAAAGKNPPFIGGDLFGVDGDDNTLAAEFFGAFADEFGPGQGAGIDADFVGAGAEHGKHVGHGFDPAADGEGHETLVGGALNHADHGGAAVGRGGDVEEDHFIGALVVVAEGEFDGVADIFQFTGLGLAELDAARDLAGVHIEAGNDTFCNHADIETRAGRQSK